MKKSFVKVLSFAFVVSLGCLVASAERNIQMKEVKSESVAVPAITIPADQVKEKIEEKVVVPAVDAKGEIIRTGKETNAPLSEIKNKKDIMIEQKEDGKVEVQQVIEPVTLPADTVEKETSVQKQEGTIFDAYSIKENLKINNPSK